MNPKLKLATAALAGVVGTLVVGGIASAAIGQPPMHFRGADADKNGEITKAEWLAAATKSFEQIDANKDGKIVVGEIPPERGPGRHGHHRFDDDRGPPPPPADDAGDGDVTPAPAPAITNGN